MKVLVVDDEPILRRALGRVLAGMDFEMVQAEDGVDAMGKLGQGAFDLVITDLNMPRADGFAVLKTVREKHPRTPVIILTGNGSVKQSVDAMRAGAFDFLPKPLDAEAIQTVVRQAIASIRRDDADESTLTGDRIEPQAALIGESAAMRGVLDMVEQVAGSDATVLLSGESGTGKEVVARLLHASSSRGGKRMVTLNCGAIPEGLIESELFGHTKGSFTGATERRDGKFVQANGGTLFLDEIGELPLPMQVRLLRVLQDREVNPVGDSRSVTVDIRIIAATNRDLEAMVAAGKFREDLYYRLAVMPLPLPPLRERMEDVPILATHFLESASRRLGRKLEFGDDALAVMKIYRWPGNVRELQNLVERLTILDKDGVIGADDLPPRMREGTVPIATARAAVKLPDGGIDLPGTLLQIEQSLIEEAMRKTGGNKSRAADLLGINRTTLIEKLKRLGLMTPAT